MEGFWSKLIVAVRLIRGISWWARQMHIHNPKPWPGQTGRKRWSWQANFSNRRPCYIVVTLINLNCISIDPIWHWWQPHHRLVHRLPSSWPVPVPCSQILFHASHTCEGKDKSPISMAAALAYCVDNHREMGGTKQRRTRQHPKLCSDTPHGIKLRVYPAS